MTFFFTHREVCPVAELQEAGRQLEMELGVMQAPGIAKRGKRKKKSNK